MNEILELQSGQVAFISSLMAGFSFSIAIQIIKARLESHLASVCFISYILSGVAVLIALYIDVAVSLQVVAVKEFSDVLLNDISHIRNIGTSAATSAFFLFTLSIGIVGWLLSKIAGIASSLLALLTFILLAYARYSITQLPL